MSESYDSKSRISGQILMVCFGILTTLSLYVIGCLIQISHDPFFSGLSTAYGIAVVLGWLMALMFLVTFVVWTIHVHRDLKFLFPDYSIGPVKASLLLVVPVVNTIGIWIVFSRMVSYLKGCGGKIATYGDRAQLFLLLFYVATFLGRIFGGMLANGVLGSSIALGGLESFKLYSHAVLGFTCYGLLVWFVQKSIQLKAADGPDENLLETSTWGKRFE